MRRRVLFLSCHLPWPPLSGGRRRELELIRRLAARFDIHLLVVSKTPVQDRANAHVLSPYCRRIEVFPAAVSAADALDEEEPLQILRHRSRSARRRVAQLLAEEPPDLIHVEGFYLMQHVPEWSRVPILLVEQNIEYELERQRAEVTGDAIARERFLRTRRAELDSWRAATQLATVTAEDRELMRHALSEARVRVVPDGADHLPLRSASAHRSDPLATGPDDAMAMVMVANFAYAPNVDAARFLCRDILPRIRSAVPEARLWLVGNQPPAEVVAFQDQRTTVTGQVPEVLPYLDAAAVVVCPLRIGGGIKVKTIEALRRGKAIVSTPVGAQGLESRGRGALAIAEDARSFAREVGNLLKHPRKRSQLEQRALVAAADLPTWDDAAAALGSAYGEMLEPIPLPARRALAGGLR